MTFAPPTRSEALTPFHIGIVATDLHAHMAELTAVVGARWTSVRTRRAQISMHGVDRTVALQVAYTVDGPFRLEVIQSVPGTIWAARHTRLHHIGCWSDELGDDRTRLMSLGLPAVAEAMDPDTGQRRWTYHRRPEGYLFELVASSNKPRLEAWWAGGGEEPAPPAGQGGEA